MMSNESAKDEIKRAADIVELIGQYVQLKKAGRNHVGLCPFHAEKDPSFTVSPERQTFHCFGCKKGGDVFSFWMEYHSCEFPEALRELAERYNVTISKGFSGDAWREKEALKEALFNITEKAATYFQMELDHNVRGKPAREYLRRRSVSKEIVSEFRLGYAPDKWEGLTSFLKSRKVSVDMAVQAGLVVERKGGGHYDRFRNRVIFPILDLRQQIIGFGGRVLDDSLPKYLNTPESPIFHKGETLYGLHASHPAIRQKGRTVIVEGYMDCLALKKYGLDEVVATLGTALTDRHIRKLKGYAPEAVVVFDSDEAGKKAALKSLPVFLNEGLSARAALLPDGHDPDSFINEKGADGFSRLLDKASFMFDFFLEQKLKQSDSDVEGKVRVLKEIFPVLGSLHNDAQRALYVRRVSERVGIKEDVIWSQLRSAGKTRSEKSVESNLRQQLAASGAEKRVSDLQLLNLLVHYPHTAVRLAECECKVLLSDPVIMEIVETIFEKFGLEGQHSVEELPESLKTESARNRLRETLIEPSYYPEETVEQAVAEFEEKVKRVKISASIQRARKRGDIEDLNRLLKLKAQGPPGSHV